MRTHLIALVIVAGVLALATNVDAQTPPKSNAVRLNASAATVTFSTPVTLDGTVKGAKAGVMVTLERRAATSAAAATRTAAAAAMTIRPSRADAYSVSL